MSDGLLFIILIVSIVPMAFIIAFGMMLYDLFINYIKNKLMTTKTVYVESVGWHWKKIIRSDGYVIFQKRIPKTEFLEREIIRKRELKLKRIVNE